MGKLDDCRTLTLGALIVLVCLDKTNPKRGFPAKLSDWQGGNPKTEVSYRRYRSSEISPYRGFSPSTPSFTFAAVKI